MNDIMRVGIVFRSAEKRDIERTFFVQSEELGTYFTFRAESQNTCTSTDSIDVGVSTQGIWSDETPDKGLHASHHV